jgi:RHS repeat-associated protein
LVDGGYYESGNYYFYINDHLGNNRIVANAAASVVQSTQYYPFGMPFADAAGQNVQPYKYNNKELDGRNGLNMYDNLARLYDPVIPNTPTVDPLAEKYYSWSPYAWVGNNPMKVIDPTGMDWYIFNLDNGGTYSHKVEQEGTHRMAIMSYEMTKDGHEYTKMTFVDFNDPDIDAKSIDNGEITQVEMLSDATVERIMDASGVRSDAAQNSPWSYAKNEAAGKMDYGHYRSLSKNTFYVRENTAYNVGDMGNYLWGMGMAKLGFDLGTAKMGAHVNNALWGRSQWTDKYNFGVGTYSATNSFWDSHGDQRAITKGYSNSPLGRSRLEYQRQYNEKVRAKWNKTFKTSFSIY